MLAEQAQQARERGFCLWWWRDRTSGSLVGQVGLNRTEVEGEPAVEVGWSISPERWRQGLATEAAKVSIDWGFERAGLDEIVSFALIGNEASQAVMRKAGMVYVRRFERRGLPHVLYRIGR
jgi:RimJ/RimL family protein N-acetyltransferase